MKFYIGVGQQSQIMWVKKYFMLSFQACKRVKHAWVIPDHLEWIMDSGSFSELKMNGKYTFTPEDYLKKVELWQPDYFVNMDWMCEPFQLERTGMTAIDHQQFSLDNQIRLTELLEDSWINKYTNLMGVIQGWKTEEYVAHIDMLREHDMILPFMGIGSVCRRAADNKIEKVIKAVRKELPTTDLHGFGVKTTMLRRPPTYDCLDSVDSQAWSMTGHKFHKYSKKRLLGTPCVCHEWKKCCKDTDDCANCGRFMNHWLNKNLKLIENNGYQTKIKPFFNQKTSRINGGEVE